MHRRALHLASVLLLLASLSSAEAAVLRNGEYAAGGNYLGALLVQDHADACAMAASAPEDGSRLELNLPVAAAAQCRAAWTMRPPSAQSASLHAVTGSSL
jgi:hypothetical protein